MLFQTLDKLKQQTILGAVMAVLLGIIMLICPAEYVSTIVIILGYVMVVFAVVQTMEFLTSKKALMNYIYFIGALLIGIVGLLVLIFNEDILRVFGGLFAFLLVLDGGYSMYYALTYARHSQRKGWSILVLLAIVLILLGVGIFVGVMMSHVMFHSLEFMMRIIGCVILFSALVNALRLIWIWPFGKDEEGGDKNGAE